MSWDLAAYQYLKFRCVAFGRFDPDEPGVPDRFGAIVEGIIERPGDEWPTARVHDPNDEPGIYTIVFDEVDGCDIVAQQDISITDVLLPSSRVRASGYPARRLSWKFKLIASDAEPQMVTRWRNFAFPDRLSSSHDFSMG